MKNFIKLFVAALALALLLASCEKGGVIEVTNGTKDLAWVNIIEGANIGDAFKEGEGTKMTAGQTQKFSKTEDGIYTVFATLKSVEDLTALPYKFNKTVTLLGGNTENVTIIKEK